MPYLRPQETDLIKLPSNPEYWVRLRLRARWGVRTVAQGKMLKISTKQPEPGQKPRGIITNGEDGQQVEMVSEAEWDGYIRSLVFGFITEWNLTDEQDQPLALTEENMSALEDEDGQYLAALVQERARPRSKQKERNFEPPSLRQSSKGRR